MARKRVYPDEQRECKDCKQTLPWSAFKPLTYHPDGLVRRVACRCRPCSRPHGRADYHKRKKEPRSDNPKLAIGPFREFIERIADEHEDEAQLAWALGVSERRLYAWRYENKSVPLDNADAALCRLGMPHMLRELWPALYEFD